MFMTFIRNLLEAVLITVLYVLHGCVVFPWKTEGQVKNWESRLELSLSQLSLEVVGWNGMDMWWGKVMRTGWRNVWSIELKVDKHNIPKGKMHSNCRLLPKHIVYKITHRNNMRRANTCHPALKLLKKEITSDIQKHKQNLWNEHLHAHWDHMHNTHILWKTIHGISNRAPPPTLNTLHSTTN